MASGCCITPKRSRISGLPRTNPPARSLAAWPFSANLVDWYDYPGNPVLYEVQRPWQGRMRMMPRAFPVSGQWVAYIVDAHGHYYPGVRCVATATSRDLVHWQMAQNPTITIADTIRASTGRTNITAEDHDGGNAYPEWALYYDGRYYLCVYETYIRRSTIGYEFANNSHILFVSHRPHRGVSARAGFGRSTAGR